MRIVWILVILILIVEFSDEFRLKKFRWPKRKKNGELRKGLLKLSGNLGRRLRGFGGFGGGLSGLVSDIQNMVQKKKRKPKAKKVKPNAQKQIKNQSSNLLRTTVPTTTSKKTKTAEQPSTTSKPRGSPLRQSDPHGLTSVSVKHDKVLNSAHFHPDPPHHNGGPSDVIVVQELPLKNEHKDPEPPQRNIEINPENVHKVEPNKVSLVDPSVDSAIQAHAGQHKHVHSNDVMNSMAPGRHQQGTAIHNHDLDHQGTVRQEQHRGVVSEWNGHRLSHLPCQYVGCVFSYQCVTIKPGYPQMCHGNTTEECTCKKGCNAAYGFLAEGNTMPMGLCRECSCTKGQVKCVLTEMCRQMQLEQQERQQERQQSGHPTTDIHPGETSTHHGHAHP